MENLLKLSKNLIKDNLVDANSKLIDCLYSLEKSENKFLVILKGNHVEGVITDGDIRRYLLKNSTLDIKINKVTKKNFHFVNEKESLAQVNYLLDKKDIDFILILNSDKKLKGVYVRSKPKTNIINNSCLIQAGGYGKRLGDLTRNTPKALIEIGDKRLIDIQIQKLYNQGFRNIYISVHHLKNKIIKYVNKNINSSYSDLNINFVVEEKPLGTFGSVASLKKEVDPFLVINCDVLAEVNYKDFMSSFNTKETLIRVGLTNYEIQIPFGVVNTNKQKIVSFVEKPIENYFINTGIYLVNPLLIRSMRKNVKLDFDDFINKHGKLGDIDSKLIISDWFDIGTKNTLDSARKFYKIK